MNDILEMVREALKRMNNLHLKYEMTDYLAEEIGELENLLNQGIEVEESRRKALYGRIEAYLDRKTSGENILNNEP